MSCTRLAALALAVATFTASGCGGSSKTTSSNIVSTTTASAPATNPASTVPSTAEAAQAKISTSPTAQFMAKADAICATANTQIQSATVVNAQDYVRVLPQDAIYFQAESAALGKLTPPPSMKGDWRKIVVGFQEVSDDLAKVAVYVLRNALNLGSALFNAANKEREHVIAIATRDGFKDCARVHR